MFAVGIAFVWHAEHILILSTAIFLVYILGEGEGQAEMR